MKKVKTFNTFIMIIGFFVWIYFFVIDWKMALIIFILIWSNNISTNMDKYTKFKSKL